MLNQARAGTVGTKVADRAGIDPLTAVAILQAVYQIALACNERPPSIQSHLRGEDRLLPEMRQVVGSWRQRRLKNAAYRVALQKLNNNRALAMRTAEAVLQEALVMDEEQTQAIYRS